MKNEFLATISQVLLKGTEEEGVKTFFSLPIIETLLFLLSCAKILLLWNPTRYTLTSSAVATRPSTGLSPAWPDLDVDLEIESLQHPERYPLIIKRNAKSQVEVGYRGQNTVKFVQNEKYSTKTLILSDFICTFAMSLMILLDLIASLR